MSENLRQYHPPLLKTRKDHYCQSKYVINVRVICICFLQAKPVFKSAILVTILFYEWWGNLCKFLEKREDRHCPPK